MGKRAIVPNMDGGALGFDFRFGPFGVSVNGRDGGTFGADIGIIGIEMNGSGGGRLEYLGGLYRFEYERKGCTLIEKGFIGGVHATTDVRKVPGCDDELEPILPPEPQRTIPPEYSEEEVRGMKPEDFGSRRTPDLDLPIAGNSYVMAVAEWLVVNKITVSGLQSSQFGISRKRTTVKSFSFPTPGPKIYQYPAFFDPGFFGDGVRYRFSYPHSIYEENKRTSGSFGEVRSEDLSKTISNYSSLTEQDVQRILNFNWDTSVYYRGAGETNFVNGDFPVLYKFSPYGWRQTSTEKNFDENIVVDLWNIVKRAFENKGNYEEENSTVGEDWTANGFFVKRLLSLRIFDEDGNEIFRRQKRAPNKPPTRIDMNKQCCNSIKRIEQTLGVERMIKDKFYVPNSLMIPGGEGGEYVEDYMGIYSRMISIIAQAGFTPFRVEIPTPADFPEGQEKPGFTYPSQQAALQTIMSLIIENKIEQRRQSILQLRLARMTGRMYLTVGKLWYRVTAILDGLGIPTRRKRRQEILEFNLLESKNKPQGFNNKSDELPEFQETEDELVDDFLQNSPHEFTVDVFKENEKNIRHWLIYLLSKKG